MHTPLPHRGTLLPKPNGALLLTIATIIVLTSLALQRPLPLTTHDPAPPAPALTPDFGKLPLSFVPNAGQTDANVHFSARGMGGTIFFTPNELVLALPASSKAGTVPKDQPGPDALRRSEAPASSPPAILRMGFDGANAAPEIVGGESLPGVVNYFLGNDASKWRTNVPTFAGITYQQLYDGIDLRYDGNEGQMKGTYLVAPGADPTRIRWRYTGAQHIAVDDQTGNLQITLPQGGSTFTERAPVAWQDIAGQRVPVSAHFAVASDGSVGFALGSYDARYALTVDPTLVYSTFLGGSNVDGGVSIAVDSTGNAYVTGYTYSTDFPTLSPIQPTFAGDTDVFITKLNAAGTEIVFSSYIGGNTSDYPTAVAVDNLNNVYITGFTASIDFPIVNTLKSPQANQNDAFIVKMNYSGDGFIYSTYFGGSSGDDARGIAVDSSGNAYIVGTTSSIDFPTMQPFQAFCDNIPPPFKHQFCENIDGFVSKISSDGAMILYSSFIGGSGSDYGNGIAVDNNGNAYIVGTTSSKDLFTTNAFQPSFGGVVNCDGVLGDQCTDAFFAKVSIDGSTLINSTYLGGGRGEEGYDIAVDSVINIYVIGRTYSENFPIKNALLATPTAPSDTFVSKFDSSGTSLVYSTFLGGFYNFGSIAADSLGNATIGYGGNGVTQLAEDGSRFNYSLHFNGNGGDYVRDIALDGAGNSYVTGYTHSTNFLTVNPVQSTCGDTACADAFVAKIIADNTNTPAPTATSTNPTSAPTDPTSVPTNPTPTPTDSAPVPSHPTQSRVVGGVTVYADSFSGTANRWTASGTVWIGNYTIVEQASISATDGALSGSGLVSMVTSGDGKQRTVLFRDGFDVTTDKGILTPRAVNGDWRLTSLVGFHVNKPPTQVTIDVLKGELASTLSLDIVFPNNNVAKAVNLTFDHMGVVSGTLNDVSFALGKVGLKVSEATLRNDGFTLKKAELELPAGLGGARAALSVSTARITGDHQLIMGDGSASIEFPNIKIGGDNGFAIEGSKVTLALKNGTYLFSGAGTFILPGVAPDTGGCKVKTSFTLASTPPPLREASLSIDGCFEIPIASTGFFLTKVSGKVQLDEGNYVAIDIGIGIKGGPEVLGVDAPLSGEPSAHWDNSWKVGLKGSLKVFKFDVANAALELSKQHGLEGTINLRLGLVLEGSGSLHIWKDNSSFHMTGRESVKVRVRKGEIARWGCEGIFSVCGEMPPFDIEGPEAVADFGEFRQGGSTVYGLKGSVDIPILNLHPAFFADVQGNVRFDQGGLNEYQLINAVSLQANSDTRQFAIAPNTPTLLAGLAVGSGAPTLSLVTPTGETLTATSLNIGVTTTATQTLLTIPNPIPGTWQIRVDNLSGGEQYSVVALGARQAATVAPPTVVVNGDGSYGINIIANSVSPTSTVSLFYDTSDSNRTGTPIVQGLSLTTTSYRWQPGAVAAGAYHIYAMVDDPLGAPAFAYAPVAVTINDTTAPDVPTGLRVATTGSDAVIMWQPSLAPDIAGYHIFYREPNGGTAFVADIPSGEWNSYTQQGLYLDGGWELAISAYDLSGNESARSGTVIAPINQASIQVFLPIVVGPSLP